MPRCPWIVRVAWAVQADAEPGQPQGALITGALAEAVGVVVLCDVACHRDAYRAHCCPSIPRKPVKFAAGAGPRISQPSALENSASMAAFISPQNATLTAALTVP